MILSAGSKGPDQTARMRSLVRAFAVRICPRTRFRMARPLCFYSEIKKIPELSSNTEALPGVWGNRGIRPFITGEQGNNSRRLKRTGEQSKFWGTGNIENQDFDFGEHGKMPGVFFRGTREQVPPRSWEGLSTTP